MRDEGERRNWRPQTCGIKSMNRGALLKVIRANISPGRGPYI